ncbi:MAG TPA: Hsp70 family protein [Opitutaceae bacterium]|nr:Hsp70 family protein [Opitutaceae bacterium]
MTRNTIDYGIDLGTTNSSIAVAVGVATEVIKNSLDSEITPSAVYIHNNDTLWVGQGARAKITDQRAADAVALEFKRRMGTGFEYQLRGGRKMRPEDLSAEVLKALRGDVVRRQGEDPAAAVITVPAAFELPQCDATKRAADLAGFTYSALLQEPVAAALAYGYQKMDRKACWLVFDFGGGTFDAALVTSRDGTMHVVNHGGDNFLGGSDLDWAIVEQLLAPQIATEYKAKSFRRGEARYQHDLLRLKAAAESAKIELSRLESVHLEVSLGQVENNRVLTHETQLTRADVARVATPIIAQAIEIARRVLREKNVAPAAVEKLIFVGGPTMAPYFREAVQSLLGIPLDLTLDPLTVVARGAAIFASTQPIPRAPAKSAPARVAGEFNVEILAKPVGADTEPLVGGRVLPPAGASLNGCTIELVNQQSKWRSGKLSLNETGAFQITARAEKGVQNIFAIELCSASGALLTVTPAQFTYTVGVVVEEQLIIHDLGVATADNKVSVHFTKGQPLPAKSTKPYRSSHEVRSGGSGEALRIPIIEGNRERADRNVLVGMLQIEAKNLKRDLPLGSQIDVTLQMDSSRLLTVRAYVPMLDEEFPAKIELGGQARRPDLAALRHELAQESTRLSALQNQRALAPGAIGIKLDALAESALFQQLNRTLSQGEAADFDALLRAQRDLMEFRFQLDEIAAQLEWPAAVQDAEHLLAQLAELIARQGEAADHPRAQALGEQTRALIDAKNPERLRRNVTELSGLYAEILYRHPTAWADQLEVLAQKVSLMRDQAKAGLLVKSGRRALELGQLEDVKQAVFKLQDLLPGAAAEQSRLGYGSTIVR